MDLCLMKKIAALPIFIFLQVANYAFSQNADSTGFSKATTITPSKTDSIKKLFYLKDAVTITNKGISYIPIFSLGKPAVLFDLSMGNGKLFFEPQLRFSLIGEPWSFLYPVRYKIKSAGKFQMSAGVNPLMNFKNVMHSVNGALTTDLVSRRYLGGEFRSAYFITKNLSVGAYYLYFHGVSEYTFKNTHFTSVNTSFSNIQLGSKFFAKINAQVYYLNQDGLEGFYFNPVLTLLKRSFPFSIQTIMNTIIHTDIPGSEKFIWNASLIYSFNKTFKK
jgi:hypothetical protein